MYINYKILIFSFITCITITYNTIAQDFTSFKEKQKVATTGGISTSHVYKYTLTDSIEKTDYTGYYSGNLNITILEISLPFTFTYCNKKKEFTHPFNQFSLQPSYKWIKAYLGYSNMQFSKYTLSNYLFNGIGLTLTPDFPINGSIMYGRLSKASEYDSTENIPASYKRIGYGFTLNGGSKKNKLGINLFHAIDDENSIDILSLQPDLTPQENVAISTIWNFTTPIKLSFNGEIANSSVTKNKKLTETTDNNNPANWFMIENSSTIARNALFMSFSYNLGKHSIGINYEKTDPEYKTFGSYYSVNNVENFSLNYGSSLFKDKWSVVLNGGIQKKNQDEASFTENSIFVGSANINYSSGKRLNFNLSYSNYRSYTNQKSEFEYINSQNYLEPFDTLNYRQISQDFSSGLSFDFSNDKKNKQLLSISGQYQNANDSNDTTSNISEFINVNVNHLYTLTKHQLTFSGSVLFNENTNSSNKSMIWGPNINIKKNILKNTISISLSYSLNFSYIDSEYQKNNQNLRLNSNFKIRKQHIISVGLQYQNSENTDNKTNKSLSGSLSYNYNFQLKKKKNKEPELINK